VLRKSYNRLKTKKKMKTGSVSHVAGVGLRLKFYRGELKRLEKLLLRLLGCSLLMQTKGSAWGNLAYLVVYFSALSARFGLGIKIRGSRLEVKI